MTPKQAHEKLLATMPKDRIRTHHSIYTPAPEMGQRYQDGKIPEHVVRDYRSLLEQGVSVRAMRSILRVGYSTLRRLKAMA